MQFVSNNSTLWSLLRILLMKKKKVSLKEKKKKSKFEGAQEMTMNNDFEIES